MSDLDSQLVDRLQQKFTFKKTVNGWLREGVCPECGKKELYTHATKPRMVKCGRLNKCGYEEHVRELFDDLFKDWSESHPKTVENPHASADAYMQHSRGFDLKGLTKHYTQELYKDYKRPSLITATVRFKLHGKDGVAWERFIDRPERFGRRKATFIGDYKGCYWSLFSLEELCKASVIWLTEGIFDSIALAQTNFISASHMSCTNYPHLLTTAISNYCKEKKIDLPILRWAIDNDAAGKKALHSMVEHATTQGFKSECAVPLKGFDWNDLFLRERLTADDLKKYLHWGKLELADSAEEAGLLIHEYYDLNTFFFTHRFRTYWWQLDYDDFIKAKEYVEESTSEALSPEEKRKRALKTSSTAKEICNVQLEPLYFQRNEITDESWYYFQLQNPWGVEVKATFTPDQISSRGKFKPRVLGVMAGAIWSGNEQQLETFVKRKTERLREVKTIDFIGYSKEHLVYIFDKHAVHKGQVIHKNEHDYFKTGRKEIKSLAQSPIIKLNPSDEFNPSWFKDFYELNGEKGLIILAWWTGSYFAEQIRAMSESYPFFEFVGQAGSGKSTLLELLWKFSGRSAYEGFDPNKSTNVAIYRNFAQVSNMPIVLIEGDRNDSDGKSIQKNKFSWDELKDAFNGRAIRSKGLKTAGNETYEPPFRGAIMISQNTPINGSEAILSRTLHITVNTAKHTLQKKHIATKLAQMPLEQACTYITHCLKNEKDILETYAEEVKKIEAEYHEKGITHTRLAFAHAQVSAMIIALSKHVLKDHLDLSDICDAQNMLEQMARERIDQLGGDHKFVEQFWEVYEYLNSTRNAQFTLNHHEQDAPTIAINLNEVYKVASRNYQTLPDIVDMRALLMTSKRYKFVEKNRSVKSNKYPADSTQNVESELRSRVVKCWIFTNPYHQKGTK